MKEQTTEVIKKEMLFLNQNLQSKEAVLQYLVQQAKALNLITSVEFFLEAVEAREQEIPTAIGYQIAIPHGKSDEVKQPFIGFLQTEQEFIWTQGYEEKVKLIFLIGVPVGNQNNLHLKFISQLSKRLLDEKFRKRLLEETDVNEVFQLLSTINSHT